MSDMLLDALMERGQSYEDAMETISEMVDVFADVHENPEDILHSYGLEPDYVLDLVDHITERLGTSALDLIEF